MASKYYDPVKAHEYYMKHRKLKGRKKGRKKSGSKKKTKTPKVLTISQQLKELEKTIPAEKEREVEIAKKKIELEQKEFEKKLKAKWSDKIKELEKKVKDAKEEDKEALLTELATLQVDYEREKKAVKLYYQALTFNTVKEIKGNESQ